MAYDMTLGVRSGPAALHAPHGALDAHASGNLMVRMRFPPPQGRS